MINESPAFQFYPAEFLNDEATLNMTLEERGMYITLLCHCWINGSLPNKFGKLYKLLPQVKDPKGKKLYKALEDFYPDSDLDPDTNNTRLLHPMIEREKRKQTSWREQRKREKKNR